MSEAGNPIFQNEANNPMFKNEARKLEFSMTIPTPPALKKWMKDVETLNLEDIAPNPKISWKPFGIHLLFVLKDPVSESMYIDSDFLDFLPVVADIQLKSRMIVDRVYSVDGLLLIDLKFMDFVKKPTKEEFNHMRNNLHSILLKSLPEKSDITYTDERDGHLIVRVVRKE